MKGEKVTQESFQITFTMTPTEAYALAAMLQNPLSTPESSLDAHIRKVIFETIRNPIARAAE